MTTTTAVHSNILLALLFHRVIIKQILCRLLPHIRGNIGLVFTNEDLIEVRDLVLSNKVSGALRDFMKILL